MPNCNRKFSYGIDNKLIRKLYDSRRRDKETTATIGHTRFKRGVFHLYNMVICATGCNPLAYKGYGCYCGFLGSGYVIDGIDQYVIYLNINRKKCTEKKHKSKNKIFQMLQDARLVLRRYRVSNVLGILCTILLEMLSRL